MYIFFIISVLTWKFILRIGGTTQPKKKKKLQSRKRIFVD